MYSVSSMRAFVRIGTLYRTDLGQRRRRVETYVYEGYHSCGLLGEECHKETMIGDTYPCTWEYREYGCPGVGTTATGEAHIARTTHLLSRSPQE